MNHIMNLWRTSLFFSSISVLLHQVIPFTTKVTNTNHLSASFVRKQQQHHTTRNSQTSETVDKDEEVELKQLLKEFDFPLDDWQVQAGRDIYNENNVIVCAPTGSGKTVVGEMALHYAFRTNKNAIYTTPLKALSNQKYIEFRKTFGSSNVGLSTGDMSINRGARITVMTTEVYRNMCWRRASAATTATSEDIIRNEYYDELDDLSTLVFDEFHYMGQPGRGSVWEESVIMSPYHTQIICLSATLPNALDLSQWIESVTERKTALVEASTSRPVPLLYSYAFKGSGIVSLFRNPDAGPGSPSGLLGLRGDGIPEVDESDKKKKNKMKKVFSSSARYDSDKQEQPTQVITGIPKGLQINPAISTALRKQTEKVNRALQRKLIKQQEEGNDNSSYSRKNKSFNNRQEKKERNHLVKREMKKNVPSLSSLVQQLQRKKLLPAIVFIFSRAGCEDAVVKVCEDMFTRDIASSGADVMKRVNKDRNARKKERFVNGEEEKEVIPNNKKRKSRSRAHKKAKSATIARKEQLVQDEDGRLFRTDTIDFLFESQQATSSLEENGDFNVQDDLQSIFSTTSDDLSDELSSEYSDKLELYAKYGLNTIQEVIQTATKLHDFNEANPEIAVPTTTTKHWLLGVAAHHAGILPAHKLLVETLYKSQLIKIVFSTETLAAGINMPARTTVITSIAKFTNAISSSATATSSKGGYGSSTHSLIPTSNFLQMAGRAGRRGMDTQGACVIVASAFEGPDDAASILIKEVEPIMSQFTPSYSLVVNLIARGNGKLDFAKDLIQKSFAMWQKKKLKQLELDTSINDPLWKMKDDMDLDVMEAVANERFITSLVNVIKAKMEDIQSPASTSSQDGGNMEIMEDVIITFTDSPTLKIAIKSYTALTKILQLERNTLSCLEREVQEMKLVEDDIKEFLAASLQEHNLDDENEDKSWVEEDMETQRRRVNKSEGDLQDHVFTQASIIVNDLLLLGDGDTNNEDYNSKHVKALAQSLLVARSYPKENDNTIIEGINNNDTNKVIQVSPDEIRIYSKTADMLSKKQRKKLSKLLKDKIDDKVDNNNSKDEEVYDSTWQDTMSLVRTLEAYGCLESTTTMINDDTTEGNNDSIVMNTTNYEITTAGGDVALLGFENSLWSLVAMGGTCDVNYESKELDTFRDSFNDIFAMDDDVDDQEDLYEDDNKYPQLAEAETHLSNLLSLTSSELAGYVTVLVAEEQRRTSMIDYFDKLSKSQQRVIQSCTLSAERFMEVQRKMNVHESFVQCKMELCFSHVVTAWASGCTWNDALELSGMSPGDLVRILHRSLDALRQFANLPYHPIRRMNDGEINGGIHPEIRQKCKEAASMMNRYPLKDPLPFDEDEDEEDDDDDDEEILVEGSDEVV